MKRLVRIAAAVLVLASSLLAGSEALADPRGRGGGGRGWERAEQREWRGEQRRDRGGRRDDGPRRGGRWDDGPRGDYYGAPRDARRAPPPGYGVRRGGQAPREYRGAVVPDYGRYRLRPPPPGFAWVRMGNRYALVSRSTGQIFDVIGD